MGAGSSSTSNASYTTAAQRVGSAASTSRTYDSARSSLPGTRSAPSFTAEARASTSADAEPSNTVGNQLLTSLSQSFATYFSTSPPLERRHSSNPDSLQSQDVDPGQMLSTTLSQSFGAYFPVMPPLQTNYSFHQEQRKDEEADSSSRPTNSVRSPSAVLTNQGTLRDATVSFTHTGTGTSIPDERLITERVDTESAAAAARGAHTWAPRSTQRPSQTSVSRPPSQDSSDASFTPVMSSSDSSQNSVMSPVQKVRRLTSSYDESMFSVQADLISPVRRTLRLMSDDGAALRGEGRSRASTRIGQSFAEGLSGSYRRMTRLMSRASVRWLDEPDRDTEVPRRGRDRAGARVGGSVWGFGGSLRRAARLMTHGRDGWLDNIDTMSDPEISGHSSESLTEYWMGVRQRWAGGAVMTGLDVSGPASVGLWAGYGMVAYAGTEIVSDLDMSGLTNPLSAVGSGVMSGVSAVGSAGTGLVSAAASGVMDVLSTGAAGLSAVGSAGTGLFASMTDFNLLASLGSSIFSASFGWIYKILSIFTYLKYFVVAAVVLYLVSKILRILSIFW